MNQPIKRESHSIFGHLPMVFCMLMLALSIFGWGLHSKLSLYSSGMEAQPATPVAKLLSEQERPSPHPLQTAQPQPATPQVAAFYAALLCPSAPLVNARSYRVSPPVKQLAFSFDGPSSLRPPPISAA